MKSSNWSLPSNEWRNDTHGGAQAGREQNEKDLREALTLLEHTKRIIIEDYPIEANLIQSFIIKFMKDPSAVTNIYTKSKAPEKAEENFVYFSKEKDRKMVLSKKGAEVVNANPDQYEYICSAPHADGDMSYSCGSDYCRCAQ